MTDGPYERGNWDDSSALPPEVFPHHYDYTRERHEADRPGADGLYDPGPDIPGHAELEAGQDDDE